MATYTITIDDNTGKTRHLLGLIKEMAKTDKVHIKIERTPNAETIEAMMDAKNNNVIKTKDKADFFEKLNN